MGSTRKLLSRYFETAPEPQRDGFNLCEKPMAMNVAEAQTMLRAAEERGKSLSVAYYRRAYPKVQRAKQLLEAGAIGKPVLAELKNRD
jgi:predicted dehydrogenase